MKLHNDDYLSDHVSVMHLHLQCKCIAFTRSNLRTSTQGS